MGHRAAVPATRAGDGRVRSGDQAKVEASSAGGLHSAGSGSGLLRGPSGSRAVGETDRPGDRRYAAREAAAAPRPRRP